MEAKVQWQGGLSFIGSADSGFSLPLDADVSAGGGNHGFRPMEMFAIGLAGCTAMDVISILRKKRQEVTHFEVQVHAQRAQEHPKVFTSAVVEYIVSGKGIEETALLRAIELSATRYCPAQAMLGKIMPIQLKYHIFEEADEGKRVLIASGDYTLPVDTN